MRLRHYLKNSGALRREAFPQICEEIVYGDRARREIERQESLGIFCFEMAHSRLRPLEPVLTLPPKLPPSATPGTRGSVGCESILVSIGCGMTRAEAPAMQHGYNVAEKGDR